MIRRWIDRLLFGREAEEVLRALERRLDEAEREAARAREPLDARNAEALQAVEETIEAMKSSASRTPTPMRTTGEHQAVPLPKRAR